MRIPKVRFLAITRSLLLAQSQSSADKIEISEDQPDAAVWLFPFRYTHSEPMALAAPGDNLIIVGGDRDLAVAYALIGMSVFNHF